MSLAHLRRAAQERPLLSVLVLAAAVRLVAAVFSRGFLAIDDHHVLVDAADRLVRGLGLEVAHKRSILFPGAVALVIHATQALADPSPATEMLVVRLVQAAYSLLSVLLVYRILERRGTARAAGLGGLLAATCWVLPITQVHQFEEVVCQVPLLASCWWVLRARDERGVVWFGLLAGLALGTALVLRFPLLPFVAAFALLAAWELRDRRAVYFALGLALVLTLQGFANHLINHEWWFSFRIYYGPLLHWPPRILTESDGYPHGAWWTYGAALLGVFVPPFSLWFGAAAIRGGRGFPLLGVPTLVFLVANSLIANRQERFLLPVLPAVIVLGAAGADGVAAWLAAHGWPRLSGALWRYYWTVNTVLLVGTLFMYGKRDRVAPLVYVETRHDATGVIEAQYTAPFPVPVFYLGRRRPPVVVFEDRRRLTADAAAARAASPPPNYLILYSDSVQADTAALARALGARLVPAATIPPSAGDELAHLVNPRRNAATPALVLSIVPLSAVPR